MSSSPSIIDDLGNKHCQIFQAKSIDKIDKNTNEINADYLGDSYCNDTISIGDTIPIGKFDIKNATVIDIIKTESPYKIFVI
jgi:hypothetical protein